MSNAGWTRAELETLRILWPVKSALRISEELPGRSRNAVIGMARRMGLKKAPRIVRMLRSVSRPTASEPPDRRSPGSRLRKAYASKGDDATLSRWVKVRPSDRQRTGQGKQQGWFPDMKHEVLRTGRSIFWRKGISKPSELKNLLVSGKNNAKIGRDVRKGLFRGYHIYTLSFEERATCPRSCRHWQTCYGNNMPYATRIDHTDYGALVDRLRAEVARLLSVRGRRGILVRLHALGDFFSAEYVHFWLGLLRRNPNLAIYGYTARLSDNSIGRAILHGKREFGRRFAIRWSDGGLARDCTVSLRHGDTVPSAAFQCPEQAPGFTSAGKPILCATCGLCWSTDKNVAFLEH